MATVPSAGSGTLPAGRERLVVCALLAIPVVALSTVPALQFGHWPWICLTLAAPVVVWGGLPLHRDAARALRRGGADDVPAALGTAGALAWSLTALLLGPAGDPGWTQVPLPATAPGPPVRLDVAAGVTLAVLLAAHVRAAVTDPVLPGRWGRVAVRIVVPAVLAVAAGTLGYRLGAGDDAGAAVAAALAVLLVAAPTAFVPRVPRSAQPAARRVDTVLFTSRTLTGGPRRLDAVRTAAGTEPDEALRLAGSVAERSEHPVARAIAAEAAARGEVPAAGEFDERPGFGASGIVAELRTGDDDSEDGEDGEDGDDAPGLPALSSVGGPAGRRADGTAVTVVAHAVLLGHPDLLTEHDVVLPDELRTARDEISAAGHTAVALAWDGRARAVLAVAADAGPDGTAAVRAVRRAGLVPAWMSARPVTAATAVAERAGIDAGPDTVLAGVRPDAEADAVALLRGRGHVVAVVGESGRDDDALAAADVGLPVGAGKARSSADAGRAVAALRRRRRRPGPVQWTAAAATAYHLVAAPLAASGMIDPLLAGVTGALVSAAFARWPHGRPTGPRDRCDPRHGTPASERGDARSPDGLVIGPTGG